MSKITNLYELEKTIYMKKVFSEEFPNDVINEAIKENGWTTSDATDCICMDSDGRYLQLNSDSKEAIVKVLYDGTPAIRARIYGIHDPEEFEKEAIGNHVAKSPLFLRYDMITLDGEDVCYIYFKPGNEAAVRETLCSECLIYDLD